LPNTYNALPGTVISQNWVQIPNCLPDRHMRDFRAKSLYFLYLIAISCFMDAPKLVTPTPNTMVTHRCTFPASEPSINKP
jgi:hypothetical protein